MKRKLMSLFASLGFIVLLTSCGKVPQAEINAAIVSIEAAQAAGAEQYASLEFNALQDSMKAVNQEIEVQKGKLFKNFDNVSAKLMVVNQMAADVKLKAEARIAEIKSEIASIKEEVVALNKNNNELLAQAPKGKEGTAALEAIKADIAVVEASMSEATNLLNNNQLIEALDKVNAAKLKAVALNTELSNVIAKYNKGKKK
jgi:hypothetical protein